MEVREPGAGMQVIAGASGFLVRYLVRHAWLFLAVGLAGSADGWAPTLEWSLPACNDPQDGPISAVFGFLLPYVRWSGASSLVYDFMPHVYAANLLARSLLLVWLIRAVLRRLQSPPSHAVRVVAGAVGLVLCTLTVGCGVSLVASGLMVPRASILSSDRESYFELRPVGFAAAMHYECTR